MLKISQKYPHEYNDPFADREFLGRWHGKYKETLQYSKNDIIGAMLHAIENIKMTDFKKALRAIDEAKAMIETILPKSSNYMDEGEY